MTVSSTAIVFTRYILIEWLRRKKNDDKTICELFYVCCDDIQDMEFSTALKQLLEIFNKSPRNPENKDFGDFYLKIICLKFSQHCLHNSICFTQI